MLTPRDLAAKSPHEVDVEKLGPERHLASCGTCGPVGEGVTKADAQMAGVRHIIAATGMRVRR